PMSTATDRAPGAAGTFSRQRPSPNHEKHTIERTTMATATDHARPRPSRAASTLDEYAGALSIERQYPPLRREGLPRLALLGFIRVCLRPGKPPTYHLGDAAKLAAQMVAPVK